VSIKKKFATAVATAGLLAGLFGSAFVPTAYATAGVPVWKTGAAAATVNLEPNGFATSTEAGTTALPMILADTTVETLTINVSELKDAFGTLVTGTASLSATGDVIFDSTSAGAFNAGYTAGSVVVGGTDVVLVVEEVSATASGTGSVTITLGGASVTVYYDILGPLASITITNGDEFTHLAADKSGTADKLTYVEKDAAGSTLAATAVASVEYSKDGATAAATEALATVANAGTTTDGVYVERGTAAGKMTIGDGSCVAADAGKTRTIALKIGTVTSNTISFVCTLGGGAAVLTGAALDDTTLYAGGTAKVIYTFTDGTRTLGFGAVIGTMAVAAVDFPNSLDSTGTTTKSTMGTWAATSLVVGKDGKATSAAAVVTAAAKVALGARLIVLSIADSDLAATTDVAKEIRVSYSIIDESVTGATLVAGPKKLKATATFGASAAGKKIAFTLENARTGAVKTYYRKANASGVATYTLRFRGTFDVTAAYGDELTDTVELKK